MTHGTVFSLIFRALAHGSAPKLQIFKKIYMLFQEKYAKMNLIWLIPNLIDVGIVVVSDHGNDSNNDNASNDLSVVNKE